MFHTSSLSSTMIDDVLGMTTTMTTTKLNYDDDDDLEKKNRQRHHQQQKLHPNDHQPKLVEVKGVRLKYFEQVLCKLLKSSSNNGSNLEPKYIALPSLPPRPLPPLPPLNQQKNGDYYNNNNNNNIYNMNDWDSLPEGARVYGTLPGQLSNPQRAKRKEDQIRSMIRCIYALLPPPPPLPSPPPTLPTAREKDMKMNMNKKDISSNYTIVDFCGGSGSLSIPLALMLPNVTIVVVDLKQKSLDYLHEKANKAYSNSSSKEVNAQQKTPKPPPPPTTTTTAATTTTKTTANEQSSSHLLQSTAIPNLFTFSGDIKSYNNPFDMGIALHACGEATDLVIRKCIKAKAQIVVAPCCVGKTSTTAKDPYIYAATKQNLHTVQYPQSKQFQQCLPCSTSTSTNNNDWNALAKAADFNEYLDTKQRRNASRRTAKSLLELDRQLYLQETNRYQTALTRMDPISASPKNDILMAHYTGGDHHHHHHHHHQTETKTTTNPFLSGVIDASLLLEDPVVAWTKAHLLHPGASFQQQQNLTKDNDDDDGTTSIPAAAAAGLTMTTTSPGKKKLKTDNNNNKDDNSKQEHQQCQDGVDWTKEEEQEIRAQLTERFSLVEVASTTLTPASATAATASSTLEEPFVFPTGMGRRKRKLIHFVADQLGLAHWCVGKKQSDKTVAVRRRYVKTATKM